MQPSKFKPVNNNSRISPFGAKAEPDKGSQGKISLYFLVSFPIFFSFSSNFLSCLYFPLFSHNLIFSFLPVCVCDSGVGWGLFSHRGMTSMTEMARATSPSSAFAATSFGASSSSVRLRYQTVGPLYVYQAGWATLPHSYYALDYCSPK